MKKTALAAIVAAGTLIAGAAQASNDPIIGQIQPFALTYCPQGWLLANGAMLQISQYQALYSLIGTRYGGNGSSTFALPNLAGGTIGPQAQAITWCMATQGLYAPNPGFKKSTKPK